MSYHAFMRKHLKQHGGNITKAAAAYRQQGIAGREGSRRERSRGGRGVAAGEGSRKGWATPAATRLRFKNGVAWRAVY
eukprot:COSAG02_NODE_2028_length_10073_cov_24.819531_6_plen_78_part_00